MDDLTRAVEQNFDPTDSDKAMQLAHRCLVLMHVCARALWAEHNGLKMGRDDSRDMYVAVQNMAGCLGLPTETGQQVDDLYKKLHGIPDSKQMPYVPADERFLD